MRYSRRSNYGQTYNEILLQTTIPTTEDDWSIARFSQLAACLHHFADYNWDPRVGAPTFVDEPAGSSMLQNPEAIEHTPVR
jgi:hypothetical protein